MAYTISQNQSKYFFLASYQLSSGVEDKILTKKYFRGGQKKSKIDILHEKWAFWDMQTLQWPTISVKTSPNIFS